MPAASSHRERTLALFDRRRFDLAEREARAWLTAAPDEPVAHAVLALALARLGRAAEGIAAAEEAIARAPDLAFAHYARAVALERVNRRTLAAAAIEEAIRLAPDDPDYHQCLGAVRAAQSRWEEALADADRALACDPEHEGALNLRSLCLQQLGRTDEAGKAARQALARAPESGFAHANAGWARLEAGDAERALVHFRESLRLDPTDRWAQDGFARAMRGRRGTGALLLRGALWAKRLSPGRRWAVVAAFVFATAIGKGIVLGVPALLPVVLVVLAVLGVGAGLAWAGERVFDALAERELARRAARGGPAADAGASPWLGVLVLGGLAFGLPGLVRGDALAASTGFAALVLVLPLRATLACLDDPVRRLLASYTGLLAVGGGVLLAFVRASVSAGGPLTPVAWWWGVVLAAASAATPLVARAAAILFRR